MNSLTRKSLILLTALTTTSVAFAGTLSFSSISASPTAATNGSVVTGTVSFTDRCPSAGCLVTLSSSNSSLAAVPTSVTVPFDQKSATFTFKAGTAAANTIVTLTGVYSGVTKTTGSNFSIGPAVVAAPPPTGTITASYTLRARAAFFDRQWNLATEYLSGADAVNYPNAIKAKYAACMTANNGNGQLTAVGGVIQKSMVSVGFDTNDYTVEQNFTCAAGYTGWLGTITQTVGSGFMPIGSQSTFNVCLVKAAPTSLVAQLLAFNGYVSVPTSITFPAGQLCTSFTVTVLSGSGNVEKIYAIMNGYRVTGTVGIQ